MAPICRITIVASTLFLATAACADPGLVAVYTDGEHTVHRVVPTPNFTLDADESVHSQVVAKFDAVYTGMLKVHRGGQYVILGDAQIELDGKNVGEKAIDLSPGDHALKVTYSRKQGPARLQLRWKSDFFVEEPIPWSAFAHETVVDKDAAQWVQIEQGRRLYEDLSCGACHGASDWNLSSRKGPDLSNIGGRVTSQWLATWLQNPRHYRKSAVMPSLLSDVAEIRDVTAFLSGLVETPATSKTSPKNAERIAAGKEIFERVGCDKCHSHTQHSLAGVGSKFQSSRALASFLANPLHVDPSGRMPQMFDPKTEAAEAELVAEFLFHTKKTDRSRPEPSGDDAERGRKIVQSRGCTSCHDVRQDGASLTNERESPTFTARGARVRSSKGCLADKPAQNTPDYQLSDEDTSSLQAFLKSAAEQPIVASAPVETFYRRVQQFNCTACHSLNDQNAGPSRRVTDDGQIITIERPPTLTGVGDKLRVSWIEKVLLEEKRTRPWMKMRMPHFGGELKHLPRLFPTASGSPVKDETPPPSLDLASAGLDTIGVQRGQNACINCHNYRGINQQTEGVVPAPDMAEIGNTLRGEWFRRWLRDPSRMQPAHPCRSSLAS